MNECIFLHITACDEESCWGVFQRAESAEVDTPLLHFPRSRLSEILGAALADQLTELSSFVLDVANGKIVGVKRLEYLV